MKSHVISRRSARVAVDHEICGRCVFFPLRLGAWTQAPWSAAPARAVYVGAVRPGISTAAQACGSRTMPGRGALAPHAESVGRRTGGTPRGPAKPAVGRTPASMPGRGAAPLVLTCRADPCRREGTAPPRRGRPTRTASSSSGRATWSASSVASSVTSALSDLGGPSVRQPRSGGTARPVGPRARSRCRRPRGCGVAAPARRLACVGGGGTEGSRRRHRPAEAPTLN